jgi:membrane-associated phospholipid phosphatase
VAATNEQAERKVGPDLLIVLESMAISGMLNQLTKFSVGRERPFAHYREIGDTPMGKVSRDENLSFYSGHAAQTFTIAASTSTVAFLRGYELAPVIALATAPVAAITGYLRIAADRHYFSDVIVGALVGSAVGILVPVLFHPRRDEAPPAPGTSPSSTQMFTIGGSF